MMKTTKRLCRALQGFAGHCRAEEELGRPMRTSKRLQRALEGKIDKHVDIWDGRTNAWTDPLIEIQRRI